MLSGLFNWATKSNQSPGIGDYGTYENQFGDKINVDKNAYYSIQNAGLEPGQSLSKDTGVLGTVGSWFEPQGQSGASTAGNVLSGVGTAVNIGSGLAGMYYANKKAKLDKERAKMEKDVYQRGVQRDMENEARLQKLASNAGNGAFYK